MPSSPHVAKVVPVRIVRQAANGGAEVVAALQAACFDSDWGAEAMRHLLARAGSLLLLAMTQRDGEPVGFLLGHIVQEEAEVLSLGVLDRWRHKGVAAALVRACQERAGTAGARRLLLEVAETNAAARRVYEACGFREIGRRRRYYRADAGGRTDALVLRADLTQ